MTESNDIKPPAESSPDEPTGKTSPVDDTDGSTDHRTGEKQAQENRETESPA